MNDKFINYINNNKLCNYLDDIYKIIKKDDINNIPNIIFYGPAGSCKYTECINFVSKYSPSNLKYEKKLIINYNNSDFYFKISDIHIEVDMEINTYNSKNIWYILYEKITDIIIHKQLSKFIIVCKNFHKIDNELLEVFYYLKQDNIILIMLTENISFIPNNIINICKVIPIKKSSIKNYNNIFGKKISKTYIDQVNNNKKILHNTDYNIPIEEIDAHIYDLFKKNLKNTDYFAIRDICYMLLTYNINIHSSVTYIIFKIYNEFNIPNDKILIIIEKYYNIFTYYNNNYRPIYHLERFLLYLIKIINELQ